MSDAKWKDTLRKVVDILPLRRMTGRIALSAGLIGLAAQSSPAAVTGARVPVSPVLTPEATVRKFKGRYVLKRVANALTVRFVGHGSHSSHSSHASHASHYSSSSPSPSPVPYSPPPPSPEPEPAPVPQPDLPRSAAPRTVRPPKPHRAAPILKEEFDGSGNIGERWRVGVLATAPETYDSGIAVERSRGLTITPAAHKSGAHFNGYVSVAPFDLSARSIAVQLLHAAAGATTIFAAAIDAGNWWGFRIEGGQLAIESHTKGRVAARKIAYDPSLHRFLRVRTSSVAPVVVWETSADGTNWNPEYVETENSHAGAVYIVLSAGTTRSTAAEASVFGEVLVEGKP